MKTISEKATELKCKALDLIESKLTEDTSASDIKTLCECISIVGTDNESYMKTLVDIISKGNSLGSSNYPLGIVSDSTDENKS